jgi:2-polyprenyl-6-methoxyphenol hydroxylase-like FAD-dependent oxidoreductase
MYDAIVVGARCAGAPTAMLLARKGYKVLMVDRDTFPSDILSTHYIHQPGVAKLKQWGLLDQVTATGCPPMTHFDVDFNGIVLSGSPPPWGDVAEAFCPRRYLLDKILVDAALAAGAELREGFSVREIVQEDGAVTGIRGRSGGGRTVTVSARIVIGADGVHSRVAQAVQAPEYKAVPALACAYYSYWSGVPVRGGDAVMRDRRIFIAFPTNDDLTCIAMQWPNEEFHTFRADIERNFMETLELVPAFAERVKAGHRVERFTGVADLPNYYRKPYGPGWALVGDAGYHKDPATGQGITDAFRDADLLAEAIDAGFSGRQPLEEALVGYEQRRNDATMAMYEFTLEQVSFQPPPDDMVTLLRALQGNQADTDRFMGLLAGTTPFPEFMNPENIGRIVGGPLPAPPAGRGRHAARSL